MDNVKATFTANMQRDWFINFLFHIAEDNRHREIEVTGSVLRLRYIGVNEFEFYEVVGAINAKVTRVDFFRRANQPHERGNCRKIKLDNINQQHLPFTQWRKYQMATITVYRCDVCPHSSESATGMITATRTGHFIQFKPGILDFQPDTDKMICGQGCAAKLLSQTIEVWNV